MLKWGKQKIAAELKRKKISAYCIKTALTEIDDKTYTKTLDTLLAAALKKYTTGTEYAKKYKAAQYIIAKGYESALVWTKLKNIRTD
jgi:regulatory protein